MGCQWRFDARLYEKMRDIMEHAAILANSRCENTMINIAPHKKFRGAHKLTRHSPDRTGGWATFLFQKGPRGD